MDDRIQMIEALEDPDAAARAAARAKLVGRGTEAVEPLLDVLAGGSIEARREAAQALAELKPKEALPRLLAALASEPYEVAAWVARALGAIGGGQALLPLIGKLDDESMRNAAAGALGELGDAAAIPPLARTLASLRERFDYGAYLGRYWLARALAALGDRTETTIEALKEVVDRDFGPETQQSWGSLRDSAVELLAEALGADADAFLLPFLKRERETLQVRYGIARRYWLKGERSERLQAILERMARHPLYPAYASEARDLLATEN